MKPAGLTRGCGAVCALALCCLTGAARPWPPPRLADTGLYTDFAGGVVSPKARPFSPQYPLWSDGAHKRRWISLPPGSRIEARQPGNWMFPAGTKFWKEFSFDGHRIETRFMEKQRDGRWGFAAYAWSEDGSSAELVPVAGLPNYNRIADGIAHDIPGVADCRACHEGEGHDAILGFTALQLSPDRDPGALYAEEASPGMIDLATLLREKRLAHAPEEWKEHPPAIVAATPRARAALGYLHANCGGCHNDQDPVASVGMSLRVPVEPAKELPVFATAVDHHSKFQIPDVAPGESYRIKPGHPELSALLFRMGSRLPIRQMPPIGTKIVDQKAMELLTAWIREDLSHP